MRLKDKQSISFSCYIPKLKFLTVFLQFLGNQTEPITKAIEKKKKINAQTGQHVLEFHRNPPPECRAGASSAAAAAAVGGREERSANLESSSHEQRGCRKLDFYYLKFYSFF